ncbi:MAG TPA: hypothetical protein IAA17_00600 [Candidatus Lachnoclostridium stercorigallinarum]|uniref:Uncharacterized protein n=1 Tax=Candidatus Lachnoclostridium stercorigallinarum TaxID=2838634 RepID=A0A9D2K5X2_9FIRM|nr:hypothetical protein [Candidatus Lachnoclostridium stercorigallinarum]
MAPRKASVKTETAAAVEAPKTADKTPAAKTETKTAAKAAKAPAKKAEAKVPAEKKAPVRRTAAKKAEPAAEVVIEFGGRQIDTQAVLENAKKAFAEKYKDAELKSIHLYIKPEESVAYYVANDGIGDPEDKVEF